MITAWKPNRKQLRTSGQAILLIALMMIGLLAIAGLAIDGAGLLLLKRQTQNAADAGILAGTYAQCLIPSTDTTKSARVQQAALEAAMENGFDAADINVYSPPQHGSTTAINSDTDYLEVEVTKEKPKYFIQLVFSGPLIVTSRAIGSCIPAVPPFEMNVAAFATGSCPNGFKSGGANNVYTGAPGECSIMSNGGGQAQGSSAQFNGDTCLVNGPMDSNNASYSPGDGDTTIAPVPATWPDWTYLFEPGSARALDAQSDGLYFAYVSGVVQSNGADATGTYVSYTTTAGGSNLRILGTTSGAPLEGLLYVKGHTVEIKASAVGPRGITIIADKNINITNSLNGQVVEAYVDDFLAYSSVVDNTNCNANADGIEVNGGTNRLKGLLFAPNGNVTISGSSNQVVGGIIAWTIDISGSSNEITNTEISLPAEPPSTFQDSPG